MSEEKKSRKIKQLWARSKRGLFWLAVVIIIGGAAWYIFSPGQSTVEYTTSKAVYGDVIESISATGTVEPVQYVFLTFKSQGYVENCYVKVGDPVSAGQVLAEERSTDLEATVQQASASLDSATASYDKIQATQQAKVDQATAQLEQAKINLENAYQILQRNQQLYAAGAISANDLDTVQKTYDLAVVACTSAQASLDLVINGYPYDLETAQAQMNSADAQLQLASSNLDASTIIAPFSGYVSIVNGNVGQWTGGGAPPVGTAATSQFSIEVSSVDLKLTGQINEADISQAAIGQEVDFSIDAFPLEIFTGRLTSIAPKAATVNSIQTYAATIAIDDYARLRSGMPATINIHTNQAQHVILVPQTAISYARTYMINNNTTIKSTGTAGNNGEQASDENTAYVVVMENGMPSLRKVVTGLSDSLNIEIKSGLKEGEEVITADTSGTSSSSSSSNSGSSNRRQEGPGGGPHVF